MIKHLSKHDAAKKREQSSSFLIHFHYRHIETHQCHFHVPTQYIQQREGRVVKVSWSNISSIKFMGLNNYFSSVFATFCRLLCLSFHHHFSELKLNAWMRDKKIINCQFFLSWLLLLLLFYAQIYFFLPLFTTSRWEKKFIHCFLLLLWIINCLLFNDFFLPFFFRQDLFDFIKLLNHNILTINLNCWMFFCWNKDENLKHFF